jgi:predicted porin
MKKSLIALAIGATAGSAFAQASVELYGRAHAGLDRWSAEGSTAPANDLKARTRVFDSGSRVGLRGNENLGGGVQASFVIETGFNLDVTSQGQTASGAQTSPGQGGLFNTGTGNFGSREAHVALGNSSAQIRFGRQNVYWGNGSVEDVGANHMVFGGIGMYTAASSGYVGAPAARLENTTKIVFQKGLAGNFAGSEVYYGILQANEIAGAGANPAGSAMGFTVRYASGPLGAQVDYAKVTDSAGNPTAANNRNNTGLKIIGGYQVLKTTKLQAAYYEMKREFTLASANTAALDTTGVATAAAGGGKQSGFGLGVIHSLGGPLSVYGQWAKLGNFSHVSRGSQADTNSDSFALGLRYNFSNRTHVYTSYSVINNAAKNNVSMSGGGMSSAPTSNGTGMGSDTKVMSLGLLHNF